MRNMNEEEPHCNRSLIMSRCKVCSPLPDVLTHAHIPDARISSTFQFNFTNCKNRPLLASSFKKKKRRRAAEAELSHFFSHSSLLPFCVLRGQKLLASPLVYSHAALKRQQAEYSTARSPSFSFFPLFFPFVLPCDIISSVRFNTRIQSHFKNLGT